MERIVRKSDLERWSRNAGDEPILFRTFSIANDDGSEKLDVTVKGNFYPIEGGKDDLAILDFGDVFEDEATLDEFLDSVLRETPFDGDYRITHEGEIEEVEPEEGTFEGEDFDEDAEAEEDYDSFASDDDDSAYIYGDDSEDLEYYDEDYAEELRHYKPRDSADGTVEISEKAAGYEAEKKREELCSLYYDTQEQLRAVSRTLTDLGLEFSCAKDDESKSYVVTVFVQSDLSEERKDEIIDEIYDELKKFHF